MQQQVAQMSHVPALCAVCFHTHGILYVQKAEICALPQLLKTAADQQLRQSTDRINHHAQGQARQGKARQGKARQGQTRPGMDCLYRTSFQASDALQMSMKLGIWLTCTLQGPAQWL